jgi:hypothetical protein
LQQQVIGQKDIALRSMKKNEYVLAKKSSSINIQCDACHVTGFIGTKKDYPGSHFLRSA